MNEARLTPLDGGRQRVERAHVRVVPHGDVARHLDHFGNEVWWFQIAEDHDQLVVEADAVVRTETPAPLDEPRPASDQWRANEEDGYRNRLGEYLAPSPRVEWPASVAAFDRTLAVPRDGGVAEWAAAMAEAVNGAIGYERGHTAVDTAVGDVLSAGRGVCQDLAHLFLALCRMNRVPARYVSGWLFEPEREGPVESHAWAEVHVPGTGWVEVDPTHPGVVDDRYVRLAIGRDYGDAVPIKGTYVGGATEEMSVEVMLEELPD